MEKGAGALSAMLALSGYVKKSSLEENLVLLLLYRVSQINGCAYCLDMHSKDARATGESEQRLYMLSAWRDAPVYTTRERVALEWAESLTILQNEGVPDAVYERASKQFSEKELIDLTLAVVTINGYNRLNIAFRVEGGNYQPGQWERAATEAK